MLVMKIPQVSIPKLQNDQNFWPYNQNLALQRSPLTVTPVKRYAYCECLPVPNAIYTLTQRCKRNLAIISREYAPNVGLPYSGSGDIRCMRSPLDKDDSDYLLNTQP